MKWLWQPKGSAIHRAKGLAIGVFSGCFPFFGLQTLLGISLAGLLRGNPLLAAIGTWVSNPLTYLPLYWFNYQVGSTIIGKQAIIPKIIELNSQQIWSQGLAFILRILLGSAIVGAIAGSLTGVVFYGLLKERLRRKDNRV